MRPHHLTAGLRSSPPAWYALHPANADTINYIIVLCGGDLRARRDRVVCRVLRLPAAPPILSLRSPGRDRHPGKTNGRDLRRALRCVSFALPRLAVAGRRLARTWSVEVVPPFLICGAVLLFVQHMTPRSWMAGAANAHNYLVTQPYVALLYFKTFFWPTGLNADYDLNPFATTGDARLWIGFAFAVFISAAAIVAAVFKKTRMIGFGLLWFLIALLPTSLFPLAEVMNDYRTFLPYIGLVIAIAGAAALLVARLDREPSWTKIAAMCAVALLPVRKRLRYFPKEQGLENRGNALARRRVKEPAQRTRFDDLWHHVGEQRRFCRRARLSPSRARVHAAIFCSLDQSRDCRRCDKPERGSRATF